jgi:HPt (histidine-containing phosphotransfer) domain-containing protein
MIEESDNESNTDVPIWDQPALEKRVRGKHERMLKLINLYLDDMPDRVEKLASIINNPGETGDAIGASDIAHAIKGVSANLGVLRLQSVASELEAAAKQHEADRLKPLMDELTVEYQRSDQVLREFISSAAG